MKKFFMAIGLCASMLFGASVTNTVQAETLSEHLAKTQIEGDTDHNIKEIYAFNVNPNKCIIVDSNIDKVNCDQMTMASINIENGTNVDILSIGINSNPLLLTMVPTKQESDGSMIYQVATINLASGSVNVNGGACDISTQNGKIFCKITLPNNTELLVANSETPVIKMK